MSDQGELFSDEEMEDIDRALEIAKVACVGLGGGPTCIVVFDFFSDAIHGFDWFWENMFPDSWKAQGVFDWWTISDVIVPKMHEIHNRSLQVVDETWAQMRKEKGLPHVPSPASTYLNDWLFRNGWQDGGKVYTKKGRWLSLVPEDGPWAFIRSNDWGKTPSENRILLFAERLTTLYSDCRLKLLQAAVKHTLQFIALTSVDRAYKAHVGLVKEASWVHGCGVKVESEDCLLQTERKGWGTTFSGQLGAQTWFHISIPVPVLLEDVRPVFSKVFVLFETVRAKVTNLHIYDGHFRIREFNDLNIEGDHLSTIDEFNSWFIYPHPKIQSGLGLSVGVVFPKNEGGSSNTVPSISFATAGADFNRSR